MKKGFLWGGIAAAACIVLMGAVLPPILSFVLKMDTAYTVQSEKLAYVSPEKTQEDLSRLTQNLSDRTVTLVYQDTSITATGDELDAAYDVAEIAEKIDEYFQNRSFLQRFYACYQKKPAFELTLHTDRKKTLEFLWKLPYRIQNLSGYTSYEVKEEQLIITPGSGQNIVDEDQALEKIITELEVQSQQPIVLKETEQASKPLPVLDFAAMVCCAPQNAEFSESANEIIPHRVGISIVEETLTNIPSLVFGGAPISLALEIQMPEVTTDQLRQKLFCDLLGSYTSKYNAGVAGRSHNISLAASKLHNRVFNDGEVFSYNNLVGQRTAAAGFQPANIYVGNKIEEGIGGGICQVSSTLYAAALRANLTIVDRTNHSMPVSYMPFGMDATVSYGSIDLKIKNSTGYPIRLEATASGGQMTVKIYGTRIDTSYDEIKLYNETVRSIPYSTVEEPSDTMKVGESRVIQNGSNGGVYRVYQQFCKNGQVVKTVLANKSSYQPTPKLVRVGTLPQEPVVVEPVPQSPVEEPSTEPEAPAEEPIAPVGPITPILPETPAEPLPEEESEALVQI